MLGPHGAKPAALVSVAPCCEHLSSSQGVCSEVAEIPKCSQQFILHRLVEQESDQEFFDSSGENRLQRGRAVRGVCF